MAIVTGVKGHLTPEQAKELRIIKAIHATKRGSTHFEEAGIWDSQLYRPEVKLDLWRARLYTESFKQTDGQPWIIRRAKAFAHYLDNTPLFISPGQRFVGSGVSAYQDVPFCIERYWKWIKRAINDEAMRMMFTPEEKAELNEMLDWWAGKTVWDRISEKFPPWLDQYRFFDASFQWAQYDLRLQYDDEHVYMGVGVRIKQAEAKLAELERTLPPDYIHQKNNVEAMLIALKAYVKYVRRWADFCRENASEEEDLVRQTELLKIAEICDWLAENPPRDYYEALQQNELIHSTSGREESDIEGRPEDRFDRSLLPYWERSKVEGMTYEEGLELTKWFLLKLSEAAALQSPMVAQSYAGQQRGSVLSIGGVDADGKDLTNDLTYMVLDAFRDFKDLNEPQVTVRIHPGTPKELIEKAFEVVKLGTGYPSFFNDLAITPLYLKYGWPLNIARLHFHKFCVDSELPNTLVNNPTWGGWFGWVKMLNWALYRGIDPNTGQQKGAETKDPLEWTGYADMLEAYLEQMRFFADKNILLHNTARPIYMEYQGRVFASSGCVDSLERGKNAVEHHSTTLRGHNTWPVVGCINAVNSMVAIKYWVFDKKEVKMSDLIDALHKNWEGYKELRQKMLSTPKYGNDDDYVNPIANEIMVKSTAVMESFMDAKGIRWTINGSNASTIFGFSWDTEATPDGRFKGDMLADGTLSPALGTDKKGPLAVLRSAGKIDPHHTFIHLLNMKLSPGLVEGEVGKEAFVGLIRAWCEQRIPHIQFNIVKSSTLRDAQAHPEKYPNLLVRVAGYSAYFADLSHGMQDGIIARTEFQELV